MDCCRGSASGLTCPIPPRSGAFLNRDPVPVQLGDRRGRSQQAADSANDRRLVLRWPRTDGSPILGLPRARIRDLGDLSGHGTGDSSANAVSGNMVVGRATRGNPSGPTAGPLLDPRHPIPATPQVHRHHVDQK